MAGSFDTPAWIALFLGLHSLGAGVGELRNPGTWAAMLADFERSPALRFLTGLVCIALGAAIYLASPWRPGDWLSVLISVIGGLTAAEGALILAAGDRFVAFTRALIGRTGSVGAGLSALLGMAFILIALSRL